MQITEIYRSIQGESSYAGLACIFVRLTGCNLRCLWCDSEYTFSGGRRMTLDEIEAEVRRLTPDSQGKQVLLCAQDDKVSGEAGGNCRSIGPLVEITGGEPMLQEREVVPLMERLLRGGYTVLLETSGERLLAQVPPEVVKIVDVKCPGSGQGGTFRMENLESLTSRDEVKFVLASQEDYLFARDFVRQHGLSERAGSVIFSPAFRKDASGRRDVSHCLVDPGELAEWMLADAVPARLGLQIHKFIWDPATKGV